MTKIFMVEMSIHVAVAADDVCHAHELVDRFMFRDAISDSPDDSLIMNVLKEIKHVDELSQAALDLLKKKADEALVAEKKELQERLARIEALEKEMGA